MSTISWKLALFSSLVNAQQCYYAANQTGPDYLVPCSSEGYSSCCVLGSTCPAGNACWDPYSKITYQYGCTDSTYLSDACPYKCGINSDASQWTAMNFCSELHLENTWACNSPNSCDCDWTAYDTPDNTTLPIADCAAMGDKALVAVYAPETLEPYASLPLSTGAVTVTYSQTTLTQANLYTPVSERVVIQPGRSPSFVVTSTDSVGSSAPTRTASASATSPPASATPSPSPSSGLSSTEQILIGTGCLLGLVLLTAAVTTCIITRRRRRRQDKDEKGLLASAAPFAREGSLSPNAEIMLRKGPSPQTEIVELPERMSAAELPERYSAAELSGEHVYEVDGIRS